jgi:hypothetical protein
LESAKDRFFELVNGLKHSGQKKSDTTSIFKTLISVYIVKEENWSFAAYGESASTHSIKNASLISQFSYQKLIKPPDFIS